MTKRMRSTTSVMTMTTMMRIKTMMTKMTTKNLPLPPKHEHRVAE